MRCFGRITIVLILAAVAFVPITAVAAGSPAADEEAIKAQVESYRKAFEARNVDGIMAIYAPGQQLFVFDAVPPREYPSWDAYKKDWETLFAIFPGPVKDAISELKLTVVGPVAYSHRIEDTHFTKKDGSDQELIVRVTDVYRKIGGKWLVVQEHVSFPADPTTGKADLLSKP
jgi:ketosteroid isomerase-like protein